MKKQELTPTVSYMRYSSHNQNEQSIEGQRRVIDNYCKQHGLMIVDEYIDRAIPGKTDRRPEFQRMIADASSGKYKAVVIYKTDRFARNKRDSVLYKGHIRELGIQIHYAAEAIPIGPEGVLMESIMEGLAEYFSIELGQKIQRGMHESALKHQYTGGGRALGYKILPDKTFAVEPKEAELVRQIFDMFINGAPNSAICEHMNRLGFRTSRNLPFTKNSIPRIIKNEKYIGTYANGSVIAQDAIPAIIDKDVFYMAQNELKKRRTSKQASAPKAEYLLSGKLFCGHCKKKMIGISGTGKSGRKFYYYYCPDAKTKKGCDLKQVPRDYIENLVVEETIRHVLQPGAVKYIANKCHELQLEEQALSKGLALLEQRLVGNKEAIANILAAIETGIGTTSLPARLQNLEVERVQIEAELKRAKDQNPVLTGKQIEYLLLQYAEQDDHKEAIIKRFVSQVFLYNDRVLIYYTINQKHSELSRETLESLESKGSEVFEQRCVSCTTIRLKRGGFVLY